MEITEQTVPNPIPDVQIRYVGLDRQCCDIL